MLRHFLATLMVSLVPVIPTGSARAHDDALTPHIYATSWGLTLSADGSGFYNDFARFTLGPEETLDHYYAYPYKRAMRHFEEENNACIYPKSITALQRTSAVPKNAKLIESEAMMRSPLRVFTPPGTNPVRNEYDLHGMSIAYALGSNLSKTIKAYGSRFAAIADETDKAKMLLGGNVDAMLANMPDAYFVFQQLEVPLPPNDPAYIPVPAAHARIVCHDTEENRAFITRLNQRIEMLVKDGEMAAFLKAQGLNAEEYLPPMER
ncbi:hypothetical protein [Kordiimonas sp.]|uniref:hypothetical protein n=1 Tax=Kordiimonas sp. TaxID=1970157 RepID=UPI003A937413